MVDLVARTPWDGTLLPVIAGGATLAAADPGHLTLVMPRRARAAAVSAALEAAHGLALPDPGRVTTGHDGAVCWWFGLGCALLAGPEAVGVADRDAALVDASDGWAGLRLEAEAREMTEAVLARLVPVDLDPGQFGIDDTARSLLGQVPVALRRAGSARFELLVPRSMAGSALDSLQRALRAVAARRDSGAAAR